MNVRKHLPTLLLVVAALVLRYLTLSGSVTGWWANVSPLLAIAFVGSVLLPSPWRWATLPALIAIDIAASGFGTFVSQLSIFLVIYAVLAAAIFWGSKVQGKVSGLGVMGRLLTVSLVYYLVTNTGAWIGSPAYAKTIAGWWQAQTVGLPGFPPTWTFFRNSFLSDMGFGALLLLAHNLGLSSSQQGLRLPWVRNRSGATTSAA